jgi:hypothetical protein
MSDDARQPTYPGGIAGLLEQMEGRRAPFTFAPDESLPPLDTDLAERAATLVPPRGEDPLRAIRVASSNHRKLLDLRDELAGHSELAVLHGLLVAHLRKRSQPAHTYPLFERLWAEQSDHLLDQLNPRWQVSAITTFGDHGRTPVQRQVGSALSVLFGTMKLYESERRYSGHGSDKPFPLDRRRHTPLAMEMDPFSIASGGLDVNMLGRLWQDAEGDPVIRPLAHALLDQLIHDPRTIFRRLRVMRQRLERKRGLDAAGAQAPDPATDATRTTTAAEPPAAEGAARTPDAPAPLETIAPVSFVPPRRSGALTWGVVCTTDADLPEIAAWAAHYLDLGATALHLFLDTPAPETAAFFAAHPAITVTTCDAAFWEAAGKPRPEAHQLRQAHNATLCLRRCGLHFLGHFDIDEFLVSPNPVARALDFVPADAAFARVRPAELLAPLDGPPRHFKRSHRAAGRPKALLETLYPTFGPYLAGGLVSHTTGKIFARTGIPDTRLGIHTLKYRGAEATNRAELPRMTLAHLHARDAAHFLRRAAFRRARGSYRKPQGSEDDLRLADVLAYLERAEGEAGLRAFFEEVCTARPELLEALDAHDMLVTHDLDLPGKIARHFGALPAARGAA